MIKIKKSEIKEFKAELCIVDKFVPALSFSFNKKYLFTQGLNIFNCIINNKKDQYLKDDNAYPVIRNIVNYYFLDEVKEFISYFKNEENLKDFKDKAIKKDINYLKHIAQRLVNIDNVLVLKKYESKPKLALCDVAQIITKDYVFPVLVFKENNKKLFSYSKTQLMHVLNNTTFCGTCFLREEHVDIINRYFLDDVRTFINYFSTGKNSYYFSTEKYCNIKFDNII